MKSHNPNYEGVSFTVETTSNGFLLRNHSLGSPWKTYQSDDFKMIIDKLAFELGLTGIGIKLTIS